MIGGNYQTPTAVIPRTVRLSEKLGQMGFNAAGFMFTFAVNTHLSTYPVDHPCQHPEECAPVAAVKHQITAACLLRTGGYG